MVIVLYTTDFKGGRMMQHHPYSSIKAELEMMRNELESSLKKYETHHNMYVQEKRDSVIQYMKEDLDDVNRALLKIDIGVFGIDELTGEAIPFKKLRVLPTARTEKEVYFTH
jgi:RNA polymerase-binding transcription factor DksA